MAVRLFIQKRFDYWTNFTIKTKNDSKWSPDSRTLVFGTPDGADNVYDYVGNFEFPFKIKCLTGYSVGEPLAIIEWYDSNK
jgi:hypothetical protein